jgi:lipopolysaccharide/colanic/teichoic acid biosynthesis glycosyltransferase
MDFELQSLHSVYLLGALGIWAIYCVYRYSIVPTVKLWETVLLSFIAAFPVFMLPRIDGGDILWAAAILIMILSAILFRRTNKKTVGTIGKTGYLRIVHMGNKNVKLLTRIEDVKDVQQIVLSPFQLSQLTNSSSENTDKFHDFMNEALQKNVSIISLNDFLENEFGYTDIHDNTEIRPPTLLSSRAYRFFKKLIDMVCAGMFLIILFPVMLIIALSIWIYDDTPIFYYQTRLGKGKRRFRIAKFRSMRKSQTGQVRSTRLGKILRISHLDELPQLINVLRGDMALIGPRPEWVVLTSEHKAPINYWLRRAVRPGLTGWAQVNYRPSKNRIMRRRKLGYDVFYIKNRSFFIDSLICLRTVQKLLFFWKHNLE